MSQEENLSCLLQIDYKQADSSRAMPEKARKKSWACRRFMILKVCKQAFDHESWYTSTSDPISRLFWVEQ